MLQRIFKVKRKWKNKSISNTPDPTMTFSNFDHYNQLTGSDLVDDANANPIQRLCPDILSEITDTNPNPIQQPCPDVLSEILDTYPNPIQQLCSDILAEIFIFCLPDTPNDLQFELGDSSISTRNAPLLLCYVCSYWRSLAISTPRLWQTLRLHSYHRMMLSIDTESIASGIRTWLDRSRELPLSIHLCFLPVHDKSVAATKCRLALEVMSQEASRWESVEFRGGVTPLHFGILPLLHTFDISESTIDGIPFASAPRLKRLGLTSLPNLTSVSAIPWDQLVELYIRKSQTISVVVEIIRRCPRLLSLSIWVKGGAEDGSLTFRSITQHDTLQRLYLSMRKYYNINLSAVTDRLTLPALTRLCLGTDRLMPEVEAKICCSQLVDFFTRSNFKLQQFNLRCNGFGPGEVLEFLCHRSCQTLTHLAIKQHGKSSPLMVDKELLIRLMYSDVDDDVPLCPKLVHLELIQCYGSDMSFPDLLGRMVQSRCFGRTQDAQLRLLQLIDCHPISREDNELLQFAKSNGDLQLCIHRTATYLNMTPGGEYGEDI